MAADVPEVVVRQARTSDVGAIRGLVQTYARRGILLAKDLVTLYEDVADFMVAVSPQGEVLGCGAVHVLWEDIAELRTLAVDPAHAGRGIGGALVDALVTRARALGVKRVFCLTFEVDFFTSKGFVSIPDVPVEDDVFVQMLRSRDEGVAEFLNLERVRPNTLGNSRMLLLL